MFELKGESAINRNDAGRTALLGDLGFRVNLKPLDGRNLGLALLSFFPCLGTP